MKNFFGKGNNGIFLVLLLILGLCTVGIAQDAQEGSMTKIEEKMRQNITLNSRNAPIDDVLRSISEQVQLNIVKSPQITDTVTVDIREVPLEEALNQILTVYNCGYVATENMIRIVPASQLTQETEKTLSKIYRIWYADVKEVETALTKIISNRGSIASSIGTSNIIVTDTESKIKAIDEFLQEVDRPTPLIEVEVRIYDIKNTNALDIGVDWFVGRNTGYGTQATGGPITGMSNSDPYVNSTFSSTINKVGSTGVLDWGILTKHMDIEVLFSAIQQKDCAKLLANPRIKVLDNETASFKAIEEIPYQQLQQGGYQSFGTTEFKEVGVELEVTPHLAKDEMVRLHVKPVFSVQTGDVEISTVGTGGSTVTSPQPVVDKREADTVALVKNGQTIVIGGLQKQTVNQLVTKVPILGDIPILGWLFTFEGEDTVNSELVVFITPNIVEQPDMTEREASYFEGTSIPTPKSPTTNLNPETGKLEIPPTEAP
ncbi:MAG: secretin and TonB N-terminal domain-containing protein [Sedimentisphaerales bacterium]|nr:secretin and TonB N-terminal domain-containing protein [Sedimentisphaerales bacterium]